MQVHMNEWYVRWFLWNCEVLAQFTGKRKWADYEKGTNLCHFFRTILLGSLITVLSLGVWAYMLITLFVMPFVLFQFVSVAITVGIVVAVIAAGIALAFTVTVLPGVVSGAYHKFTHRQKPATHTQTGLRHVAWSYMMGIKNRFCPTIKFHKDAP